MRLSRFFDLPRWQAFTQLEALRLRETLWGPVEDLSESRRALAAGGSFADRLLQRAQLLAQRQGWDLLWQRWVTVLAGVSVLLAVLAVMAGAATALGALGDGRTSVNVVLVLLALLGLHALTFLFWLISVCLPGTPLAAGSWVGDLCFYLSRRWVRGPDAALLPQAFSAVLARARARVWCLGMFSHLFWLLALLAAFCTSVALLMARSYQFNWETTLLSPDSFVWFTETLGALPRALGFAMPDTEAIRLSGGMPSSDAAIQAHWSSWLLGILLVYGILPRLLALVWSMWRMRRLAQGLRVDESLPGLANLRARLQPTTELTGLDAVAGADRSQHLQTRPLPPYGQGERVMLGLEWSDTQSWPPVPVPHSVQDLGCVDSRVERLQVVAALQASSPSQLIVVCNVSLTPDRGTMATLVEWAELAERIALVLWADASTHPSERYANWRSRLLQAGFSAEQIHTDFSLLDKGLQ